MDNPIREEVLKYFRDQDETDDVLKADEILRKNGFQLRTDDERGDYEIKR
jgi:hypothetical protein